MDKDYQAGQIHPEIEGEANGIVVLLLDGNAIQKRN
jgi:hypothetical protein